METRPQRHSRAFVRARPKGPGDTFTFAGKTIDFGELELRPSDNTIHLTVMEAEFLRYLVRSDRPRGFAKIHSRRSLGTARRHRYARHR